VQHGVIQEKKDGSTKTENVHLCFKSSLDYFSDFFSNNNIQYVVYFRLILTMDPRHGELSRAMRNRGIEICILGEVNFCFIKIIHNCVVSRQSE